MVKLVGKCNTLDDYYNHMGENGNPAEGTINHTFGYSTANPETYRYTRPILHKDATCTLDVYNMPVKGSVIGLQAVYFYYKDEDYSQDKKDEIETITIEEFDALEWKGDGAITE